MVRKWLILVHRYLGISLALLFLTWFVSGIAMIYARDMPRLTSGTRLERLPALDLARVRLNASEAAERAGLATRPVRVTLLTIHDRPAYRFPGAPPVTIFADTGEVMRPADEHDAVAIAARFMDLPASAVHHVRRLDRADQWTIAARRQLPLHKIAVNDDEAEAAGTELYVSEALGEVVVQTTRGSRALAWVAAIPHWLYFAPLRLNDGLWRQVILWTSGLGVISVLLGLVLAVTQVKVAYAGLMRWHYLTGVVFGVFTLTWVFSGLLSMEPWFWAASDRDGPSIAQALSGGSVDLSAFPAIDDADWDRALPGRIVKEIDFRRLHGEPYFVARGVDRAPILVAAKPLRVVEEPFATRAILDRVRAANPGLALVTAELLPSYDAYYYDRDRAAPLPVLRLKFDDADRTWAYVDPRLNEVVARFTRRERVQRWLYHGLHSLDFPFWYDSRAWEVAMIALLSGGATLSAIGVLIGWRRLRRTWNPRI